MKILGGKLGLYNFGHCYQEIYRLGQFCRFLEKESIMYLDLGLGSHYLFTVVLHPIRDIPIFDNVVDMIDARVG